jgi:hypothetical protein
MSLNERIAGILQEVQKGFAGHKKALRQLRLIQKEDPNYFNKYFLELLKKVLVIFKRELTVERIIQFVISFATEKVKLSKNDEQGEDNNEFALFFVNYLLEYTTAKEKAVRFRTTQLISGIVTTLDDSCEIRFVWSEVFVII